MSRPLKQPKDDGRTIGQPWKWSSRWWRVTLPEGSVQPFVEAGFGGRWVCPDDGWDAADAAAYRLAQLEKGEKG